MSKDNFNKAKINMKSSLYTLLFFLFTFNLGVYSQEECNNTYTYPITGHFSEESKKNAIDYYTGKKGICTAVIDEENHTLIITTNNQVDRKSLERLVRQLKEFYLPGECKH